MPSLKSKKSSQLQLSAPTISTAMKHPKIPMNLWWKPRTPKSTSSRWKCWNSGKTQLLPSSSWTSPWRISWENIHFHNLGNQGNFSTCLNFQLLIMKLKCSLGTKPTSFKQNQASSCEWIQRKKLSETKLFWASSTRPTPRTNTKKENRREAWWERA